MRRRMIVIAAIAVLILAVGGFVARQDDEDGSETAGTAPGLATREMSAGEVEVKIEPLKLDDGGAAFDISLDTHAVELEADLTLASLDVDGRTWPVENWSGDGPGGHHREGELRFRAAGPATGRAVLTIAELPEPAEATWVLEG